MINYQFAQTDDELIQILELQRINHFKTVTDPAQQNKEGFVSVEHDLDLLKKFNYPYQHAIAKSGEEVTGFALVMERKYELEIPILVPMFKEINKTRFREKLLGESNYIVMGQVCIAKAFRGQGLFQGLYHQLRKQLIKDFPCIITEISAKNPRSIRAHQKVGFETIKTYEADGFDWVMVGWDFK